MILVRWPNSRHLQSQRKCSIKDDDNIKLLLRQIKKMQNTAEVKKLAIDKTVLST